MTILCGVNKEESSNDTSTLSAANYFLNSYQMASTNGHSVVSSENDEVVAPLSSLDHKRIEQPTSRRRTMMYFFLAFLLSIISVSQLFSRPTKSISDLSSQESNASELSTHPTHLTHPVLDKISDLKKDEQWDYVSQVVQSSVYEDEPLSRLAPYDLNIPMFDGRPAISRPTQVFASVQGGASAGRPLPTNEWFLNLLVGLRDDESDNFVGPENRVYSLPYVVDTVGQIVGIRLHFPRMLSWNTGVQTSFVDRHGLTLGTTDPRFSRRYTVDEETLPDKLGVGIRWESEKDSGKEDDDAHMRSSIIRGMPYGTMQYAPGVIPAVSSEIMLASAPMVDSEFPLNCGTLDSNTTKFITDSGRGNRLLVNKDVELHFSESDFTWLVFFSYPVYVECFINPQKITSDAESVSHPPGEIVEKEGPVNQNAFILRVASDDDEATKPKPLIVRIALGNNCTTGANVQYCNQNEKRDQNPYMELLREHADIYPSAPSVSYAYSSPVRFMSEQKTAQIYFDWSPRSMLQDVHQYYIAPSASHLHEEGIWFAPQTSVLEQAGNKKELLMYALPHHTDIIQPLPGISSNTVLGYCVQSLHGNACLVSGGKWAMDEDLDGPPNFMADRPPDHHAIAGLAQALNEDIKYSIPEYFERGSGDTYFSGKMLAKLGRIIVIALELKGLALTPDFETNTTEGYELKKVVKECKQAKLPAQADIDLAIGRLRRGVEVWLNGTAEARLVYDNTWGGIVSCGCNFNGNTQSCDNHYPNCPTFSDPGLNFGNGFYNDHHFHYGYHIYAASVVAKYDLEWGRKYFENVLLLIRDIANPSVKDLYFPSFRQKDWYLGNSWASGIGTYGGRPYMNGRNQESSSEAIAAYEAVAMYGAVMVEAWGGGKSSSNSTYIKNAYTAARVRDVGRLLSASELRSADRYWHVYHGNNRRMIYPPTYEPPVVGMVWDTMAQFQTWFGNAPYLACGIQLLPLTPISERRDDVQWARQLYPTFSRSCEENEDCTEQGWSILQYAILATVGHRQLAVKKILGIPKRAFESAGGCGHSLSNSIWYASTRPDVIPLDLENPSTTIDTEPTPEDAPPVHCGCPSVCTEDILNLDADGASCKNRIQWLMTNRGFTELQACKQVGGEEFPLICGRCNPSNPCSNTTVAVINVIVEQENVTKQAAVQCSPCTKEVCRNKELNRCQLATAPYLCHTGPSRSGCSSVPWQINRAGDGICFGCCELFAGCEN